MIQNLKNSRLFHQVAIVAFAILLFIPGLGSVHLFDWDEINFAESAREMLVTGDFLTVRVNYEPFWEKPPDEYHPKSSVVENAYQSKLTINYRCAKCDVINTIYWGRY